MRRSGGAARWLRASLTIVGSATLAHAGAARAADPEPDFSISPEIKVDEPTYAAAGLRMSGPAMAFDGVNHLVVWTDTRLHATGDVFAARVSPAGVLVDLTGLPITDDDFQQYGVAAAFGADQYLIVWQDSRTDGRNHVYGARMTAGGAVLDPGGFPVSPLDYGQGQPRVASDGTAFLVVWSESRTGGSDTDIYGARVAKDGSILDKTGIAIATGPTASQSGPAIAFDGTNYLVTWTDTPTVTGDGDIHGARVTPSGAVLDKPGFAVATVKGGQGRQSMAFDGTNYLVAWQDGRIFGNYDVYAARVAKDGSVVDTTPFSIAEGAADQRAPGVAFDGTDFLVSWESVPKGAPWDVEAARVGTDGKVADMPAIPLASWPGSQGNPAVGFGGGSFLVTWASTPDASLAFFFDIYGARVSPAGALLDTTAPLVSNAANQERHPAAANGAGSTLVVWQDLRAPSWDIYGIRLGPSGAPIDPAPLVVAGGPQAEVAPVVAFNGADYLVAWQVDLKSGGKADSNVRCARVSGAGVLLDKAGIDLGISSGPETAPAVASDGTAWLVAWAELGMTSVGDMRGKRVTAGGAVADPAPLPLSSSGKAMYAPAVAFGAGSYFAVWEDTRPGAFTAIYGARVSPTGMVMDPSGVRVSKGDMFVEQSPAVAFDGANFVVAWTDTRKKTPGLPGTGLRAQIYGTRVSPSGSVVGAGDIAISSDDARAGFGVPALAFDGTATLVAWADQRSGSYDVYARQLATDGTVIGSADVPISAEAKDELAPALAGDGKGHTLVAYQRYDPDPKFQADRVRARLIGPPGGSPDAGDGGAGGGGGADGGDGPGDGPTGGLGSGGGCGCRLTAATPSPASLSAWLLVAALRLRRRRRTDRPFSGQQWREVRLGGPGDQRILAATCGSRRVGRRRGTVVGRRAAARVEPAAARRYPMPNLASF